MGDDALVRMHAQCRHAAEIADIERRIDPCVRRSAGPPRLARRQREGDDLRRQDFHSPCIAVEKGMGKTDPHRRSQGRHFSRLAQRDQRSTDETDVECIKRPEDEESEIEGLDRRQRIARPVG